MSRLPVINSNLFSGLSFWKSLNPENNRETYVVYAGNKEVVVPRKELVSWQSVDNVMEFLK